MMMIRGDHQSTEFALHKNSSIWWI